MVFTNKTAQPVATGELQPFNFTCPYCHRGFEAKGLPWFQPRQMICTDCSDAYDAKIAEKFQLSDHARSAAVRVGCSDNKTDRQNTILRWKQVARLTDDVKTKLELREMIQIAENYIAHPSAGRRQTRTAKDESWAA